MSECAAAAARPRRNDDDDRPPSSSWPPSYPDVRLVLVGGQSVVGYGGGVLFDRVRRLFPNARVVQTYACTEAGSSVTFEDLTSSGSACGDDGEGAGRTGAVPPPPSDAASAAVGPGACVGRPPPHIEVGIFHPEEAAEAAKAQASSSVLRLPPRLLLPRGRTGIIGTRGQHVMSGYWDRGGGGDDDVVPDAGDDRFGGWVLTNDLGYIHPLSGKLYFRGRADDVIRTGGESVLAADVESVILDFAVAADDDDDDDNDDDEGPTIVECVVFPLPDEKFGEAVCAAVVLSSKAEAARAASAGVGGGTTAATNTPHDDGDNDVNLTVEEDEQLMERFRRYCSNRQLASFKQPRRVFRMQALPRNSSGKVLKHAVIKLCASKAKNMSRL
jgi:acyl-CoA synthetase (AMP-forming)/AMP-acid ligase II